MIILCIQQEKLIHKSFFFAVFFMFFRGSVFISSKFCFQLFLRRTQSKPIFFPKMRRKRSKRSSTYESLAMVYTVDPPTCSKHQKVKSKKQWVVVIWANYDNHGFIRNLSVLLEVCFWKDLDVNLPNSVLWKHIITMFCTWRCYGYDSGVTTL